MEGWREDVELLIWKRGYGKVKIVKGEREREYTLDFPKQKR